MEFFFKRIFKKTLDVGYLKKLLIMLQKNNFHDFLIPVFSCQLAQDCELHKKLTGEKYLEIKLDGVRALHIYPSRY